MLPGYVSGVAVAPEVVPLAAPGAAATPLRDCDVTWSFTNCHHDRRAASRAANSCTTNRDASASRYTTW